MKGQISIDYIAGAMIFFASVVFLLSHVFTALPGFSQSQTVDDLTLSAWSMSEVVMEDTGQTAGGDTAWHQADEEPAIVGLKDAETGQLSQGKIEAFLDIPYATLKGDLLNAAHDFNIEFTETVAIDTSTIFSTGSSPDFLEEPDYDFSTGGEIHYGGEELAGEQQYFLLVENEGVGWHNRLYVSEDRDFSDDLAIYNLTEDEFISVGGSVYTAGAGHTEVSDGNLLILRREIGRTGEVPPEEVGDIVSIDRYGVLDDSVVEVSFRLWS